MLRQATSLFVLLLCTPLALGQSEEPLRARFEGKTVVVKLDMPAHSTGVNVYPDSATKLNYPDYAQQIKRYGVSLRKGESVTITKVKVKEKNIEFQLGGGGYGTAGDDTWTSVPTATTEKTTREKNLERDMKTVSDPVKKRRMEEARDELRKEREREDARLKAATAQAEVMKQETVRRRALEAGSRFNLRFPQGVPERALTPEFVRAALGEWVEFEPEHAAPSATCAAEPLHKGLTEAELRAQFGAPVAREAHPAGEFTAEVLTFRRGGSKLVATLVEGVMVRYTLTSE